MTAPAALARAGLSGPAGEALDPCAAIQAAFELEPDAEIESRLPAGRGRRDLEAARELIRRYREDGKALRRWRTCRPMGRAARDRAGSHARARARSPDESLAALPGAELPRLGAVGVLPVGRRVRVSRPASGCDGAGPRGPEERGPISSARQDASSWKETFSTGGTRRRDAAFAPE